MKRLSRLIELCACALYLMALMVPLPVWWMATMLDEHGIGLPELPVIAVALALSFGVFVLARKTEDMAMECRTLGERVEELDTTPHVVKPPRPGSPAAAGDLKP